MRSSLEKIGKIEKKYNFMIYNCKIPLIGWVGLELVIRFPFPRLIFGRFLNIFWTVLSLNIFWNSDVGGIFRSWDLLGIGKPVKKMKNCFYSDTENKACDDSFVLHIAVNTNVSEGFVFTAISSTNQILCQIATSVVEFQAQEIGPDNFTSRHYRKYQ